MNDHATIARSRVRDPVCGMEVDPVHAAHRVEHGGSPYYFCGAGCADKFRKDPQRVLAKAFAREGASSCCGGGSTDRPEASSDSTAAAGKYICPMCPGVESEGPASCPKCGMALEPAAPLPKRQVQFTCPMHPEIVQDAPGACPKCGMALEPMTVSRAETNPELVDMTRRFWVGAGDAVAGLIGVADPIKATTPKAIRDLRADGLRVVMLTGDNRTTAEAVARKLGIDDVEAEVLPQQKGEIVKKYQAEGRVVAMAGDGVNDAPALAEADVGIAMGTGTDVAIQSAGVTLIKGDLAGIVRARYLSRAVMRNIRQNLFLAFVYNSLGVPVAAGVLYPLFGLLLSPVVAAAAMSLSSLSVVGNALRLRAAKV